MFTISPICVGGVIIIAFPFLITYMLNDVLEEDLDRSFFFGWFLSTIGFGICLIILLYQNGIVK